MSFNSFKYDIMRLTIICLSRSYDLIVLASNILDSECRMMRIGSQVATPQEKQMNILRTKRQGHETVYCVKACIGEQFYRSDCVFMLCCKLDILAFFSAEVAGRFETLQSLHCAKCSLVSPQISLTAVM